MRCALSVEQSRLAPGYYSDQNDYLLNSEGIRSETVKIYIILNRSLGEIDQ